MKPLEIRHPELARAALDTALVSSAEARVLHRLHCIVLLGAGFNGAEVAAAVGADPRTLQRWATRFNLLGVDGLREAARPGRPAALTGEAMRQLAAIVAAPPHEAGHDAAAWSVELLRTELRQRFEVTLSARQCQRLLTRLSPRKSLDYPA